MKAQSKGLHLILDAAETEFGAKGYQKASMADIARRAGVAKSLLHYHFHAKADIFMSVQSRTFERLQRVVFQKMAAGSNPSERLRIGLWHLYTELEAHPSLARVLLELHTWGDDGDFERCLAFSDRSRALLVTGLEQVVGDEASRPSSPCGCCGLADAAFRGVLVELATPWMSERRENTRQTFEWILGTFDAIWSGVIYAEEKYEALWKKETWNPIRHVRSRAFWLGGENASVLERIYHKGHARGWDGKKVLEIPA